MLYRYIGAALVAAAAAPALAQATLAEAQLSSNAVAPVVRDPVAGVVLNQTVTVLGQDFYRYFAAAWRDKDAADNFSIAVYERPSARLGSEVWVEFAQRRVYQAILAPTRSQTRAAGEAAADAVYEAVVVTEMQRKLLREHDLAPDEI